MATFPTSPQPIRTQTSSVQFRTLVSESEDGYEQRKSVWPRGKRRFKIQYDVLTQAEMQTLWDFYTTTASGTYNSFTFFDQISNANYTCRFTEDSFSIDQFAYRVFRTGLEIIEVF